MIVYHVDKFGILRPGENVVSAAHQAAPIFRKNADIRCIEHFFDGKLQMFALQTLVAAECGDHIWAITEAVLEYVRALKFAKLPSRLAVLYASRTIEEARRWHCHMLPENPEAKIVQLCTGRKVYSSNYALRDEMYARIAEIAGGAHGEVLWKISKLLAVALPAAENYWKATTASHRVLASHNMGSEELFVVPPVRVIGKVEP